MTITSVSGGMTSAYLAANFPSDALVFALVRIEDEACRFKDEGLRRKVEDKIGAEFIATAEDDAIIWTMFDLEQYLGQEITWVTGPTFDKVLRPNDRNMLPNVLHRYCTQHMKVEPIFNWWRSQNIPPITTQIGYRANEQKRATKFMQRCNADGYAEMKAIIGKSPNGRNRWGMVPWQRPSFPLIEHGIYKDAIVKYWSGKPVRFAAYNNCVGCFHRNALFLRYMYDMHPQKMAWFESKEGEQKGYWRNENGQVTPYARIRQMARQVRFTDSDFSPCDAGYCGM
jgi:hypothetical protein